MYFLLGWLRPLRVKGEYFAVEQLRLHAEALLRLVNEREPLSSYSQQGAGRARDEVHIYYSGFVEWASGSIGRNGPSTFLRG
jgi:hypothetical protein